MDRLFSMLEGWNWDNPLTFAFVALAFLVLTGRWLIAAPAIIAIILGQVCTHTAVVNQITGGSVELSVIVYAAGGFLTLVLAILSFFRYMFR
jgi:hypothetical protein